MSENVSNSSLYDIVQGKKSTNKRRVGYTVSTYAGVLSALKRIDEMDGSGSQSILGKNKIDWKKVQASQYDPTTGFATGAGGESGLWKMGVNFYGSTLIYNSNGEYSIEKFEGVGDKITDNEIFPNDFNEEKTTGHFKVGAYLDIVKNGVAYFNNFYRNATTKDFKPEDIIKVINGGYLVAQVIFPNKEIYFNVKVLGQFSENGGAGSACIYLNTPILGCAKWDETGITINALHSTNETNPTQSVIQVFPPDDSGYKIDCANAGGEYDYLSGTITNFNVQYLRAVKERQVKTDEIIDLKKPTIPECLVRLYIPEKYKEQALQCFGETKPIDLLFQEEFALALNAVEAIDYQKLSFNLPDGNLKVVVDYGHEKDKIHGIRGAGGVTVDEKKYIKSLADKMIANFNKVEGVEAIPNKVSGVGASARAAIAKGGTCIISVHFNSVSDTNAKGVHVFWDCVAGHPQSKILGQSVYDSMVNGTGRKRANGGKVNCMTGEWRRKNGGFLSTVGNKCVGILLEPGFLSNYDDLNFFNNDNNMETMAQRIVQGTISWYSSYQREKARAGK